MKPLARGGWIAILLLVSLFGRSTGAHEARPGYLELRENSQGHYTALWKQPANGEYALGISPLFPADCVLSADRGRELVPGALMSRFGVACPRGLDAHPITIAGLDRTLTDVVVRIYKLDGTEQTLLARPSASSVTVGGGQSVAARAAIYLGLGVQHILMGVDHLLFVLGLLLIVRGGWPSLVKTVSAFTVAHSLTLAAATLGWGSLPPRPLNAAIALSILFLGPEIARSRAGGASVTIRRPWLVAFAFGLLHGFGFAGGLAAMGLPRSEIPLALLLFNCGVEFGQLGFVLLILALARAFRLMQIDWPRPIAALPGYTVGALGVFWTLQRVLIYAGAGA